MEEKNPARKRQIFKGQKQYNYLKGLHTRVIWQTDYAVHRKIEYITIYTSQHENTPIPFSAISENTSSSRGCYQIFENTPRQEGDISFI